ncbi:hypothetical protein [Cryptosporangium minutisporangium]|uniref:FxLD family lantipeptide n=1 Tax=Cryptosporangium minutisporangium TaxID=113569 RepID=A0ABP6T6B6_9ACTN
MTGSSADDFNLEVQVVTDPRAEAVGASDNGCGATCAGGNCASNIMG